LLIVGFWKFVNTNIQDEMFLAITNALTSLIFVHQIIMQKTTYAQTEVQICIGFGQFVLCCLDKANKIIFQMHLNI
jgi:hypothetical protein